MEVQRREWEESALNGILPQGTVIEPVLMNGVSGEMIHFPSSAASQVILFFHGGGYSQGSCITHRKLAAHISMESGKPVLLVDYRLAPENPFPAALEDGRKAYFWLLESKVKAKDIVFGGDSAGGGLAAALLLYLRDTNADLPAAAFLMSPWLDMTFMGESLLSRKDLDPMVSKEDMMHDAMNYCKGKNPEDPYISPVYGDLMGLPPLLIQVGDHEVLLSDSARLAEKAQRAGVEVHLRVWDEMWHVWQAWMGELPEAGEAIAEIGRFINGKLSRQDEDNGI